MCVSLAPAHFSKTTLLAAETEVDGKLLHVLGYQNTVQNGANVDELLRTTDGRGRHRSPPPAGWSEILGGTGSPSRGSGNAMILPIPAVPETMSHHSILDTSWCRHILDDVAEAVREHTKGLTLGLTRGLSNAERDVVVFDHDVYTVVLARDALDIPAELGRVPDHRRPALKPAIFDAYAYWYPKWTVALCCFDTQDAKRAAPMLWVYEPMIPQALFAPALDAHTGNVPDLNALVEVDHTVAVSSHLMKWGGEEVRYRDVVPATIRPYLPSRALGQQVNVRLPNGDFVYRTSDVRNGKFNPARLLPPGAGRTGNPTTGADMY